MSTLKSDKGLIAPLPSRAAQPVWRSRLVSRLISCSLFVGALCLVALQATDYGTISPSFWQDTRIIPHAPSHDPFHFSNCPGTDTKFKCGYLDVPLDWTNSSDPRTARLAVTLYQAGAQKSPRTIVVNPGGPGGSGTETVFNRGPVFSSNFSDGHFDVLGWDPRGVNLSSPHVSCFPHDAYRDRWALVRGQVYETGGQTNSTQHLELNDAMNEASMEACRATLGDIPRFVSTAFVARDLDAIRAALKEEELTAYMVSYGTGIGQTYAQMFPERAGRMVLDGLEYVLDHRELAGFGTTALDNVTDAWRDGFLGECIRAGPSRCALATSENNAQNYTQDLSALLERMSTLFSSILARPVPGYTAHAGPGIVRYEDLLSIVYPTLYSSASWPSTAQLLAELEKGNATMALERAAANSYTYEPDSKPHKLSTDGTGWPGIEKKTTKSEELGDMVVCADSYDAQSQPMEWWAELQRNMTQKSFISGNSRFFNVLPCRHFDWTPAEVYRGGMDHDVKSPLLLIGETYDPATPLRNGRRLAHAMGVKNARLVVHHGYGHASRDYSSCTRNLTRNAILHGVVPAEAETDCYADSKPYQGEADQFGEKEWKALVSEVKAGRM